MQRSAVSAGECGAEACGDLVGRVPGCAREVFHELVDLWAENAVRRNAQDDKRSPDFFNDVPVQTRVLLVQFSTFPKKRGRSIISGPGALLVPAAAAALRDRRSIVLLERHEKR